MFDNEQEKNLLVKIALASKSFLLDGSPVVKKQLASYLEEWDGMVEASCCDE